MCRKGIVCLSKLTCLLLIVCLAAVSVLGCNKSATVEPIKIGFIGDLTGDTAIWGQAGSKAGQMTTDEINAAGGILGRQIQFIPMDGRGQAVDSVNAFNSLVDQGSALCDRHQLLQLQQGDSPYRLSEENSIVGDYLHE